MAVRRVLTDIEGTTSAIAFVKEVLFPYASEHLATFVGERRDDPQVSRLLDEAAELADLPRSDLSGLVEQLQRWIAEDRKVTPLKGLQGLIWRDGYETGAYRAHLYEDAHRNLSRWHDDGIALYVYSSGSIAAQRLFFQYSEYGDLRPLFSGYFDTTTGPKTEPASYRTILATIGGRGEQTLFLSDAGAELDAAREAGFETCWLLRESDLTPEQRAAGRAGAHPTAASFDEISLVSD